MYSRPHRWTYWICKCGQHDHIMLSYALTHTQTPWYKVICHHTQTPCYKVCSIHIGYIFLASSTKKECRSMMGVRLHLWLTRDYLCLCKGFAACITSHIWLYSCKYIGGGIDYTQRNVSYILMEYNTILGSGVVMCSLRQNSWTHNAQDAVELRFV